MKRYRFFGSKCAAHLIPIPLSAKLDFIIRVQLSETDTVQFKQRVLVQILKYADENCFIILHDEKPLFETAPLFAQYPEPLFFEFNAN